MVLSGNVVVGSFLAAGRVMVCDDRDGSHRPGLEVYESGTYTGEQRIRDLGVAVFRVHVPTLLRPHWLIACYGTAPHSGPRQKIHKNKNGNWKRVFSPVHDLHHWRSTEDHHFNVSLLTTAGHAKIYQHHYVYPCARSAVKISSGEDCIISAVDT